MPQTVEASRSLLIQTRGSNLRPHSRMISNRRRSLSRRTSTFRKNSEIWSDSVSPSLQWIRWWAQSPTDGRCSARNKNNPSNRSLLRISKDTNVSSPYTNMAPFKEGPLPVQHRLSTLRSSKRTSWCLAKPSRSTTTWSNLSTPRTPSSYNPPPPRSNSRISPNPTTSFLMIWTRRTSKRWKRLKIWKTDPERWWLTNCNNKTRYFLLRCLHRLVEGSSTRRVYRICNSWYSNLSYIIRMSFLINNSISSRWCKEDMFHSTKWCSRVT